MFVAVLEWEDQWCLFFPNNFSFGHTGKFGLFGWTTGIRTSCSSEASSLSLFSTFLLHRFLSLPTLALFPISPLTPVLFSFLLVLSLSFISFASCPLFLYRVWQNSQDSNLHHPSWLDIVYVALLAFIEGSWFGSSSVSLWFSDEDVHSISRISYSLWLNSPAW